MSASHQCRWQKWRRWISTMHASRIHRGCTRAWRLYRVAFILKVWVGNADLLSSQLARVPNGKKHKQKAQSSQKSGKSEKQNNIKKWLGRFNHSQKCWNPDKVRSHCQETGLVLLFVLTPIEALNLAFDLFRGNYIHLLYYTIVVGGIHCGCCPHQEAAGRAGFQKWVSWEAMEIQLPRESTSTK